MKNTFLVIPGLTRNPVFSMFSWIPACEGMTTGVIFIGLTSRRQDGSGGYPIPMTQWPDFDEPHKYHFR
jgi:hypothetical protein